MHGQQNKKKYIDILFCFGPATCRGPVFPQRYERPMKVLVCLDSGRSTQEHA